jgi:hypothetical protein
MGDKSIAASGLSSVRKWHKKLLQKKVLRQEEAHVGVRLEGVIVLDTTGGLYSNSSLTSDLWVERGDCSAGLGGSGRTIAPDMTKAGGGNGDLVARHFPSVVAFSSRPVGCN